MDKEGKIYRIEFYKQDKFAGMILVKFEDNISIATNKNEEMKKHYIKYDVVLNN